MNLEDENTMNIHSDLNDTLQCDTFANMLCEYAMGELDAELTSLVQEHIRNCKSCANEVAAISETVNLMQSNDPAKSAPTEISPKRRQRMIWLMLHPFIAKCVKHYKITSFVITLIVLTLVLLGLFAIKAFERPKTITVTISTEKTEQTGSDTNTDLTPIPTLYDDPPALPPDIPAMD